MFNLTGTEIVVILLLALVVLGPEKLPDAIRRFGRAYSELKKLSTGFQQEFKTALDEPMREMRESADMLRKSADFSGASTPDLRPADDPPLQEPTTELPFGDSGAAPDPPGTPDTPDAPDAPDTPSDETDRR